MRVDIFDVGHGQCAVVTAPNGRRVMLDCGDRWGERSFWTPSLHYLTFELAAGAQAHLIVQLKDNQPARQRAPSCRPTTFPHLCADRLSR
jgi:hypothetical protein